MHQLCVTFDPCVITRTFSRELALARERAALHSLCTGGDMEQWPYCKHKAPCALKTGTRPGTSFGKNFFVCCQREQCDFIKPARLPAMQCPVHGEVVAIRCPTKGLDGSLHYRCKLGKGWCGVTQLEVGEGKENHQPNICSSRHIRSEVPTEGVGHSTAEEEKEERDTQNEAETEQETEEEEEVEGERETESDGQNEELESTEEEEREAEVEEQLEAEESEGEGKERDVERDDVLEDPVEEEGENGVECEVDTESHDRSGEEGTEEDREREEEEREEPLIVEEGSAVGDGVEGEGVTGDQGRSESVWQNWREEGKEASPVKSCESGEEERGEEERGREERGEEERGREKRGEEVVTEKGEGDGETDPQFKLGSQYRTLFRQLHQTEVMLQRVGDKLPDGGAQLREQRQIILRRIKEIKRAPPPDLSLARAPQPGSTTGDKLFQKGLNFQARLLTSGVVEQLHSSLESCPSVDTLAPQPEAVRASLFPHQRRALAWLLWRERQTPSGGILADEMGLGKTLSMISLILQNPSDLSHHCDNLVSSRATLVVCAPSLIHQWDQEISSKLRPHTLSVLIYHGSRRTKFARELADHDVVITTYDTVGAEGASALSTDGDEVAGKRRRRVASSTTLFQVYWHRIILDEAHKIRNHKTAMAVGVTGLKKVHRWAVTGTPVQNRLMDLYSLIRFLELAPFDDIREWKHSIERKSVVGMQRLKTMVSVLMLRRTKEDISSSHKLPDKLIQTHTLDLRVEEQNVYDALFLEARKVFVRFLAEHRKEGEGKEIDSPSKTPSTGDSPPSVSLPPAVQHCLDCILLAFKQGSVRQGAVLVMLLRLRQCCCHPGLMVARAEELDVEEGLEEALDSLSLDHVTQAPSVLPPVFRGQRLSTKVREVLKEVRRIRGLNPPEKCIIVSQWKSLLDIIKHQLESDGITWTSIDSRVSPKQRSINVAQFNSANAEPASLQAQTLEQTNSSRSEGSLPS